MNIGKTNCTPLKRLGLGAVAVGLLALLPTSSFAAPVGGMNEARNPSSVTKVDHRCWWSDGERHCGWFDDNSAPRVYGYYYEPNGYYYEPHDGYRSAPAKPEAYRPGSRAWWKSMERWGRSGDQ
jgi:hypothetical protein